MFMRVTISIRFYWSRYCIIPQCKKWFSPVNTCLLCTPPGFENMPIKFDKQSWYQKSSNRRCSVMMNLWPHEFKCTLSDDLTFLSCSFQKCHSGMRFIVVTLWIWMPGHPVGFLFKASSCSLYCVWEQWRLWRDCTICDCAVWLHSLAWAITVRMW